MPAVPKLGVGGRTIREERGARRLADDQHWREVCQTVDRRDGYECRVCERRCSTTALNLLHRAERDHLVHRSLGGPDESWNLATLCKECHEDKHIHGTLRLSGNADERNEMGQLAGIRVERLGENGWRFEAFV
jgi:hypothetical protein